MRMAGKNIGTYILVRPMKINSFAFEDSVFFFDANLDKEGREGHTDLHFGQTYENESF
jgi:hypothetical protein